MNKQVYRYAGAADPAAPVAGPQPRLMDNGAALNAPSPTAAQFRRFIKSRPYVPLHELRRRFELNGELDDVAPIRTPQGGTVYVGLPSRESQFLADLAREGDIGLDLCHDPLVPMVVGVYPIRPVTRG